MKLKACFSKILAVICAITLTTSAVYIPETVHASDTVLDITDFADGAKEATAGTYVLDSDKTLKGYTFTGVVKFGHVNDAVIVGWSDNANRGFKMNINGNGQFCVSMVNSKNTTGASKADDTNTIYTTIAATDVGYTASTIMGAEIPVQITWNWESEDANYAKNITFNINVNGYTLTKTLAEYRLSGLKQRMLIVDSVSTDTAVSVKAPVASDNVLDITDFANGATAATAGAYVLDSNKTLKGYTFDGIVKFGHVNDAVVIGWADNANRGFKMNINGNGQFCVSMVNSKNTTGASKADDTNTIYTTIAATDVGYTASTIMGAEIPVQITWNWESEDANYAKNITFNINVNGYTLTKTLAEYRLSGLKQRMLIVDSVSTDTAVTMKAPIVNDTVLDITDFANGATAATAGAYVLDNNKTLKGYTFDGIVKFGHVNDAVVIGWADNANRGFKMNINGNGQFCVSMVNSKNTTGASKADDTNTIYTAIAATDVGYTASTIMGAEIPVQISWTWESEDANYAKNITFNINVNGYILTKTLAEYRLSGLKQRMLIVDYADTDTAVTVKAPIGTGGEQPDPTPDPTPDPIPEPEFDKTISTRYIGTVKADGVYANASGTSNGNRLTNVADDKITTLDGVMFDAIYNFSDKAGFAFGNSLKGGNRFQMAITTEDNVKGLRYQFVGGNASKFVALSDLGYELGTDIRIKVGFTFADVKEAEETADITAYIKIGDTYVDTLTTDDYSYKDSFVNSKGVIVGPSGAITLKNTLAQEEPEPEPEYKDDSEYTVVAIQDFTGEDVCTVQDVKMGMRPSSVAIAGTLDGLMIDGIYNFSGSPIVNIGSNQSGLQIYLTGKGEDMRLRYVLVGSGIVTDLAPEDIGMDIYETDLRIKAGFTFSNLNEAAGTADVTVQISIGEIYKNVYTVKNYDVKNRLQRILHVDAKSYAGSVLTLKAVEKPAEPLPEVPADSEYKYITFENFGITKEMTLEGKESGHRAGKGDFGGYMLEGVFNLTGGATVNFGGKYKGLQMSLITKGGKQYLRYQLIGSGLLTDVSASKLGCDVSGTDLRVKVGFSFANVDEAAGTADVTVQIHIGDTYKNIFKAEQYKIANLERIMFLDTRIAGSKLILRKPKMEHIIFEEFGFTKNYEFELGLKKK